MSFAKPFLIASFAILSQSAFAQIQFKLQWLPDSLAWGVFAKPDGVAPSEHIIVGSGQVTLVSPKGYSYKNLKSCSGKWEQNSFVGAPRENPGMDYISFGLVASEPPIPLREGEETLLFTFAKTASECPDTLYLMANNDPFNNMPNSAHCNPGNDLTVMDAGKNRSMYSFSGIYAPEAWNCRSGRKVKVSPFIQGSQKRGKKEANRP